MTPEKLLDAIGDIGSTAILDARAEYKKRWTLSGKRLLPILAAALIALVLATAAAAHYGAGDWFRGLFAGRVGEVLTPGQGQYIDENTVEIGQSLAVEGWTVTAVSAVGDDYHAFIRLHVTAPEDTVLDSGSYLFEDGSLSPAVPGGNTAGNILSTGTRWTLVEDGCDSDNSVTLLYEVEVSVSAGSDFSYRDGNEWELRMENFCVWQDEQKKVLQKGVWNARFTFVDADGEPEKLEFIDAPVTCTGQRMMGDGAEVSITSFRLTPFGADCEYKFDQDDTPEALDFFGLQVVMKDGSTAALAPRSGGVDSETGIGSAQFALDAPIALTDAAYITLPDGTAIFPAL